MNDIEGIPILDRPIRGIGRKNSTLVGGDADTIAEEIRYLRRIGATPTAVVWEKGFCPVVYVK